MKKILITTGIFPPDIGGPATQLDYLIREILNREPNFKITVLTFGEKNGEFPYNVYKVSKKTPKILKIIFYFLKTFYLSFKNDIIYSWDLYTAGLSSFIIKKILRSKKLIIRFVGDSAWEYYFNKFSIFNPEREQIPYRVGFQFSNPDNIIEFQKKKYGLKIEFKKWLRKKILISADIVVVPSIFMKKIALKIGVEENRIKLIYNSVDFLFAKEEVEELKKIDKNFCRKELNFKEGIYLVSISRFVPWKGQECLIEIMPDLIKKHGNIFLIIIGEGPEENNLKFKIKNLKLENNIFMLGKLKHKELFKYLRCADIFILNTFYEGLSHTILEAMRAGIPVLTSDVCSNSELIDDSKNGFLFEYNNKNNITAAIQKIIENPELAEKFAEESKKKLEGFNFQRLTEETIKLLC